jgi:hypothetical protein
LDYTLARDQWREWVMASNLIGLADAIEGLRHELGLAIEAAKGSELSFEPTSIELTLEATLTKSAGANAKVGWSILGAGAKGSVESATVQTLKLTLTPKMTIAGIEAVVRLEGED